MVSGIQMSNKINTWYKCLFILYGINKQMSEKKVLKINPDLFKIPDKTRKNKEPKTAIPKIKMNIGHKKVKSIRRNVMKMIRAKQQEDYEKMFGGKSSTNNMSLSSGSGGSGMTSTEENKIKSDLQDSVDFFSSLAKKEVVPKNKTLRMGGSDSNVALELPDVFDHIPEYETVTYSGGSNDQPYKIHLPQVPIPQKLPLYQVSEPPHGCMKYGGTKPTYRNWMTQKNHPALLNASTASPLSNNIQSYKTSLFSGGKNPTAKSPSEGRSEATNKSIGSNIKSSPPATVDEWRKKHNGWAANQDSLRKELQIKREKHRLKKMDASKNKKRFRQYKRRKIYKRTYKVGRHKTHPRVGVLVSNRTIRNNITTQSQLLKQTPIQEVKKFLIRKGLIKVGSLAPNEVLRKMYETVSMVCGDVQNHNSENMLYNYIHGGN
jgi:hypothetical protein